jgi:hypothetical protein
VLQALVALLTHACLLDINTYPQEDEICEVLTMDIFGAFIGQTVGRLVNAVNSDRKLKCEGCKEITLHVNVSYVDYIKRVGNPEIMAGIGGVFADFAPGSGVLFGNPYTCEKCRKLQLHGGTLSSWYNKERPYNNLYL